MLNFFINLTIFIKNCLLISNSTIFRKNCQIFNVIVEFEINCQISEKFAEFSGKLSIKIYSIWKLGKFEEIFFKYDFFKYRNSQIFIK